MIQLRSLTRTFASVVPIRNLSLEIASGERVAVIGPSGAGKTTLLRLVNGMLPPDSGEVLIDGYRWGTNRSADRSLHARIGTVYQHFNLVPRLSIARNVQAGRLGRLSAPMAVWRFVVPETAQISELLRDFGIAEKIHKRSGAVSGGEQQRAAIARALFQDPDILLADEPIASVDPTLSQWILDKLNNWARAKGATLIINLHQIEFARNNFERIVGLRDGQIMFDEKPAMVTDRMLEELYVNEKLGTETVGGE